MIGPHRVKERRDVIRTQQPTALYEPHLTQYIMLGPHRVKERRDVARKQNNRLHYTNHTSHST